MADVPADLLAKVG